MFSIFTGTEAGGEQRGEGEHLYVCVCNLRHNMLNLNFFGLSRLLIQGMRSSCDRVLYVDWNYN